MKDRKKSENSFDELQAVLIPYEESERKIRIKEDIIALLNKYGNKLREKDGSFISLQGSFAKSKKDVYVIGLRYIKLDNSYTEDHFLFEKGKCMVALTGNELEKILPEYRGAHKWQPLNEG